jgi:hypothetical protein
MALDYHSSNRTSISDERRLPYTSSTSFTNPFTTAFRVFMFVILYHGMLGFFFDQDSAIPQLWLSTAWKLVVGTRGTRNNNQRSRICIVMGILRRFFPPACLRTVAFGIGRHTTQINGINRFTILLNKRFIYFCSVIK